MLQMPTKASPLPFSYRLDAENFYQGTSQEEALSRLHFLVDNRRRLGWLQGSRGAGKSVLLNVFSQQLLRAGRQAILTSVLGVDPAEFLWKLAAGLGANPHANATSRQLWLEIDDRIAANRYQRRDTALLIDDAGEADPDVLTAISRLSQSDLCDESRLTIVLAADIAGSYPLGHRLQELIELRIELEPWSLEETEGFVRSSLSRAGFDSSLFDDTAIARLHDLSGGLPRRVQQLAELAWIAGVGQDLDRIDEDTVDSVDRELVMPSNMLLETRV